VTKEDLNQLCDLRKEIKELDDQIEELKEQKRVCRDKVQSSMKEFPYCRTTATIFSVDAKADKQRRAKLTAKEYTLLQRRQQAAVWEVKLSEYIKGVPDSKIRRIMSLKYEKGLSWQDVALEMNMDRTYPEKLITKYLRETQAPNGSR